MTTTGCARCGLPAFVTDDAPDDDPPARPLCEECREAEADAWLTGATPERPEGRTVDPRTGMAWGAAA